MSNTCNGSQEVALVLQCRPLDPCYRSLGLGCLSKNGKWKIQRPWFSSNNWQEAFQHKARSFELFCAIYHLPSSSEVHTAGTGSTPCSPGLQPVLWRELILFHMQDWEWLAILQLQQALLLCNHCRKGFWWSSTKSTKFTQNTPSSPSCLCRRSQKSICWEHEPKSCALF